MSATHSPIKKHSPSAFHAVVEFQVRHLRRVPHRLLDAQKSHRVEFSRALRSVSRTQQGRHWHDIITFDESQFYLDIDHESIWLPPDENLPERERHMVESEKLTMTMTLPTYLFHWRNDTKLRWVEPIKKVIAHADNARPHTGCSTQTAASRDRRTDRSHTVGM
jgi:hypothetical protein